MLNALCREDWVASVRRGMTERRQHRWYLTRKAVDLLYVSGHDYPTPREEAQASALVESGRDPRAVVGLGRRFSLDHEHLLHQDTSEGSPFAPDATADGPSDGDGPSAVDRPARGVQTALRRLAMLEPIYRLAPGLLRSGRVRWPADGAGSDLRMTDFRLLRHGGFYHAVARYGEEVWTPFIHVGLHATERAFRRKRDYRFWGVGCYSHQDGLLQRMENRIFESQPVVAAEPSVQVVVVVAADALGPGAGPADPDGDRGQLPHAHPVPRCQRVERRGLVQRAGGAPAFPRPGIGSGGTPGDWPAGSDVGVACDPPRSGGHRRAHLLPAVQRHRPVSGHAGLVAEADHRASQREVNDRLGRFVRAGLVAVYDRRYYLAEWA